MSNNWIYHWVQIMAHHKKMLGLFWLMLIIVSSTGVLTTDSSHLLDLWTAEATFLRPLEVLFLSSVIISLFFGWQSESVKSGLLNLLFLNLAYIITIGLASWFDIYWGSLEFLALIIASTLVTANFIHLLSTLHREMARGLFQFDAVAEAVKLNHSPIFLSNLTTALGVICIAWFEPELAEMAWVISLGVLVSYLFSVTLFPWLLLTFFLEFRVGNSRDRQGFYQWMQKLEALTHYPILLPAIKIALALGFAVLFILFFSWMDNLHLLPAGSLAALGTFLVIMWGGLGMWWQQFSWSTAIVLTISLVAIVANMIIAIMVMKFDFLPAGNIPEFLPNKDLFWLLMWIAPMGIVVDDLIHFFSRMKRAKSTVFASPKESVRFAMISVGRPILVTSITLVMVMLLIFFVSEPILGFIALNVLVSVVLVSLIVLFVMPFVMIAQYKK